MTCIDLTDQFLPIIVGLNVALIASAATLVIHTLVDPQAIARFEWRRYLPQRPVLVR